MEYDSEEIAIDLVLLPNKELLNDCLYLNQKYDLQQKLPLNLTNCLPHVTLAMGTIKSVSLNKIAKSLKQLAAETSVFDITISGIYQIDLPDGEQVFGLDLQKDSQALQRLHQESLSIIKPYAVAPTLMSLDPVWGKDEATLEFIKRFPVNSSHFNYRPHITLGFGSLPFLENITLNSTIEGLFICQLGNYCTCTRVVESFPFK